METRDGGNVVRKQFFFPLRVCWASRVIPLVATTVPHFWLGMRPMGKLMCCNIPISIFYVTTSRATVFCSISLCSYCQGPWRRNTKHLTKDLITFLAGELKALFHEGVTAGDVTYHIAVIGSKGDLKWVSKIACLTRGFEHQGRVQALESCHQCLAGGPGIPAEDFSNQPCLGKDDTCETSLELLLSYPV